MLFSVRWSNKQGIHSKVCLKIVANENNMPFNEKKNIIAGQDGRSKIF